MINCHVSFVEKLGYGICYVKSLNGKLRFVCRRFALDSSVCIKSRLFRRT